MVPFEDSLMFGQTREYGLLVEIAHGGEKEPKLTAAVAGADMAD